MTDPEISVIVPVYNEQDNIQPLLKRLTSALKSFDYELLLIDDGSTDQTFSNIRILALKDGRIKVVSFSRNFGHQMALTCGYLYAKGSAVISIDADLQDPPELIREMVQKWKKGAKVVYAKRQEREGETTFKKQTASLFYRLINFLSDTNIPADVGDYRLLDRKVVDFLNSLKEQSRFLRGLVAWGGYPAEYVYFKREKRFSGKTHYSLSKMINFALEGITSFSIKPLRLASYFGFIVGVFGFIGIIYTLINKLIHPQEYIIGWTGLFVGIMFLGGIQLITIGIIGEYVGKIYQEVRKRPQYIIGDSLNIHV